MRNSLWPIINYCVIAAVILALPLQGAWAQEYSPEIVRELAKMHYNRAREWFRNGEYKRAETEFREVLNFQPKHQGAKWYLKLTEKEVAKYEQTFQGRLEKRRKEKLARQQQEQSQRSEQIKDALDLMEQRSKEVVLKQEQQAQEKKSQEKVIHLLDKTKAKLMEDEKETGNLQKIIELHEQGKRYLQQGLYAEATACFDKVIELGGEPNK